MFSCVFFVFSIAPIFFSSSPAAFAAFAPSIKNAEDLQRGMALMAALLPRHRGSLGDPSTNEWPKPEISVWTMYGLCMKYVMHQEFAHHFFHIKIHSPFTNQLLAACEEFRPRKIGHCSNVPYLPAMPQIVLICTWSICICPWSGQHYWDLQSGCFHYM